MSTRNDTDSMDDLTVFCRYENEQKLSKTAHRCGNGIPEDDAYTNIHVYVSDGSAPYERCVIFSFICITLLVAVSCVSPDKMCSSSGTTSRTVGTVLA